MRATPLHLAAVRSPELGWVRYGGSGVAEVGQKRRGRHGELAGVVLTTRPGSERGERRRKGSKRVRAIPVMNSDR